MKDGVIHSRSTKVQGPTFHDKLSIVTKRVAKLRKDFDPFLCPLFGAVGPSASPLAFAPRVSNAHRYCSTGHFTYSTMTFAAMDTTSNVLSQILHLLAQHQDVQTRLRSEILEARHGGQEISYDQLCALPLLDAICRETLRLYVDAQLP